MNPNKNLRIEKVTLNFCAGKDQAKLEKGMKLLKHITGISPVKTTTQKRIAAWGLRPGLPIGCKITLRKEKAREVLRKLLEAKHFNLKESQFDTFGNIAFGIPEYIDVPGVSYLPELGIMGFEVCITLERPGYRIKKRKLQKVNVPIRHRVKKVEAMEFMKNNYKVSIGEESA